MSTNCKTNLHATVIATHFARLMLLLDGAYIYRSTIVYYNWNLSALYFLLFLTDVVLFLMFWFLKPSWEFNLRIIDMMWIVILTTTLLSIGIGLGLLAVFCIQVLLLVWPRPYIPTPEQEATDSVEVLSRIKCSYCGAIYAYNLDSIVNGEVVCQNCGKSFRT
jgi:uncharacterized Zn-finger protein